MTIKTTQQLVELLKANTPDKVAVLIIDDLDTPIDIVIAFIEALDLEQLEKISSISKSIGWTSLYLNKILLHSANINNIALVEKCLKLGADYNATDEKGNTALHNAVLIQSKEIADLLLSAGIDEHIKNKDGKAATELAIDSKLADWVIQKSRSIRLRQLFTLQKRVDDLDRRFRAWESSYIPLLRNSPVFSNNTVSFNRESPTNNEDKKIHIRAKL